MGLGFYLRGVEAARRDQAKRDKVRRSYLPAVYGAQSSRMKKSCPWRHTGHTWGARDAVMISPQLRHIHTSWRLSSPNSEIGRAHV